MGGFAGPMRSLLASTSPPFPPSHPSHPIPSTSSTSLHAFDADHLAPRRRPHDDRRQVSSGALAMSDALRRAVWDGSIPVRVLLDPSECRIFDQADAYYFQARRVAYLPFYLPRIYRFFEPFLIDKSVATVESAWFEVDNAPLRWHWPVGLLHDFYTALDPTKTATATTPPTNHDRSTSPPPPPDPEPGVPQLPWTITLRFASYPHDLLTTLTPTSTHDSFINTVKEADFARNGTAKAVMSLSPADSRRLFASLQDHDFDGFWGVSDKMLKHSGSTVRNIPLRIYNPETSQVIQGSVPVRQAASILRGGDPQTLGGALNSLVPMLFPSRRSVVLARPVMHGVVLPLSVPLVDLMQEAMYPDGFLHITLAMMDDDNDTASSYVRLTHGEENAAAANAQTPLDRSLALDRSLDGDADWVML
ncbi:hypothetical protein Dda_2054 [Drechslerella dactyloides]|uniref:Autophagy protein 5 n=1 Tax=Drechslerella dactyloides TaxID=74499 RepID=A0AAD6J560_DREDA|nr:hypothetical protein Dda_2054 [Drechslerella dactyloides]